MAIQLTGSLSISGSVLSTLPIASSSYSITSSLALDSEKATNSFDVTGSLHVTDSVNGSRYTSSIQTLSSASGDFLDNFINFVSNNYDNAIIDMAVGFDTSLLQVGDKVIFSDPFNIDIYGTTSIFSGSGQTATIQSITQPSSYPIISMSFSPPFQSTQPEFGIGTRVYNGGSLSVYRNLSNPVSLDNGAEITGSVNVSGSITANEYGNHIIPTDNETYDLGSSTKRWRDLYLSGSTIYLGDQVITETSYAAVSSSAISGGGAAFPHTGSAIITGSLAVTGSTDFSYKKSVAEAWSTTANLPSVRVFFNTRAAGTTNATIAQMGWPYGSSTCYCTLEYNGVSWSDAASGLPNNTRPVGPMVGTQNDALTFGNNYVLNAQGGYPALDCTDLYNGTSWSDTGHTHNCPGGMASGFGTSNSAVKAGMTNLYGFGDNGVEEYNGSSWTVVNPLPSAIGGQGSAGTQNAGVIFGNADYTFSYGGTNTGATTTLEYNGTTWSNGGSLTTARQSPSSAKNGTQNSTLAVSGVCSSGIASCTEKYNGATWSSAASFPGTSKHGVGGSGNGSSALAFGGHSSYVCSLNSYEYTGASEEQVSNLSTDTNGIIKMTELGANLNFADDSAAATGGIPIGGLYHTSGTIKIRLT